MDMAASQCTSGSGCESGWTHYLDHSQALSTDQQYQTSVRSHGNYGGRGSFETEEDLSMVSDASSGPPNYHEDCDQDSFNGNGYQHCTSNLAQSSKKLHKRKSSDQSGRKQRHSCLDDTASSPVLSSPNKNVSLSSKKPSMEHVSSQGFSATHFKGKSAIHKHFGFFKPQKPASEDLGGFHGRKWN